MNFLSRVVWSEGMYLGPHHFQAQSRYFEDSIQFATCSLSANFYGLLGGEMDHEALRNGTLSLLHARGIFPDGLLVKMPESDPVPPPRSLGPIFPGDRDKVTVFLCISSYSPDGLNCAEKPVLEKGTRYLAETRTVRDEWNGRDEKKVRVGRKNISLALETELDPQSVAMPVARVIRSGSGQFIFDENFVPPTLQIAGSERLMSLLKLLIEVLEDKSDSLARRTGSSGKTGYSTREVANFWFLHAVNSGLAPLRHLWISKHGHPEELYMEMARLAGALCTFTLEIHPSSIPAYDHAQPDECFDALDKLIRRLLEAVLPTNCLSIELTPAGECLSRGSVTDKRCLGPSTWIFGIRAKLTVPDLIEKTPQLIKICSEQFVPELVKRALPGLTLTHLPIPPSAVSATAETQYFLINKLGACWTHLLETAKVGVYVPGEFVDPEFELLVVLNS
jgi:type VI secretion system protein ImpJ